MKRKNFVFVQFFAFLFLVCVLRFVTTFCLNNEWVPIAAFVSTALIC